MERSQKTEIWQMFSQSTGRATGMTLATSDLTSVPVKIMQKAVLGVIQKHLNNSSVIGPSQHRFMRRKSCLSNLISCYDAVTHLADQEKPVYIIFLDFSRAFDIVSHSILLDKMSNIQLDKHTMQWMSNWLTGQASKGSSKWGHVGLVTWFVHPGGD